MKLRTAVCYTCGHKFNVDEETVNGRLPCPKCDANSYFNDIREPNFVEILEVKEETSNDVLGRANNDTGTINSN